MIYQIRDECARVEGAQQRVVGLQVQGDDPSGKFARNGNFGSERYVQRPQAVIAQEHIRLVGMHDGDGGPEGTDGRVGTDTVRFDHIALRFNRRTIHMGLAIAERVRHRPAGCQRCTMQEFWR